MLGVDPWVLVVVAIVLVVASAIQGLVGLGLGLVSAPVITLLDASLMPTVPLVLAIALPMMTLVGEHEDIDWRGLGWSMPTRVLGTGVGVVLVTTFTARELGVAVALMVLLAVGLTLRAVVLPVRPETLTVVGFISGITGTTTSIGGPPMAILYQHQPPRTIRTTLAVFFILGAMLSLTGLALADALDPQVVLVGVLLTPCLLLGVVVSRVLKGRVPDAAVRPVVLGLCSLSALILLVRSLFPS